MTKCILIAIFTSVFSFSLAFSHQTIEELSEYHCTIYKSNNSGGKSNFGSYCPIVGFIGHLPHFPSNGTRVLDAYVIVGFTVTKDGSTTNIRVLNSYYEYAIFQRSPDSVEKEVIKVISPANPFHRISVKAASMFKFKPFVQDGELAELNNVIFKIDYLP